jgi:hypothetical protein
MHHPAKKCPFTPRRIVENVSSVTLFDSIDKAADVLIPIAVSAVAFAVFEVRAELALVSVANHRTNHKSVSAGRMEVWPPHMEL